MVSFWANDLKFTQVCRILAKSEWHLEEDWQKNVGGGSVGHDLGHGGSDDADDQVDHPHRKSSQGDQVLDQPCGESWVE